MINDLADRFEREWREGSRPRIEAYLAESDPALRTDLLEELLKVERELRWRDGEGPAASEYVRRFPDHAALIEAVFRRELSADVRNAKAINGRPGRTPANLDPHPAASTLAALTRIFGAIPRVLLCDTEDDNETFVLQPASPEMPWGAGRYQFLGQIGQGGMGAILKGRDPDLCRDLAVKVLLKDYRDDPVLVRRFIKEAQIGGQLQHPGIVPVHELGQLDDGRPFFTMKLVKGRTLSALLAYRQTAEQDRPRFMGIFEQVCQTVAYAHARGVIHRDLKPSNVMVGAFGEVQVMDWGLAKVLREPEGEGLSGAPVEVSLSAVRTVRSDSDGDSSTPGSILGTPAYMAPEQARGEVSGLSERWDVFGLGSILCEILTGEPAYVGASRVEIFLKARRGETADALKRLDGCGADVELISLARGCLELEPGNRPRDAGEVARRLTAYFAGVQERLRAAELARAAEEARATEAKATAVAAERARAAEAARAKEAQAAAIAADGRARAERRARRMTVGLAASVLLAGFLGSAGWSWVERDRMARIAARASQVSAALQEATEHRAQAKSGQAGDLVAWAEALAAAQKARDLLDPALDPALRARVESMLAGISAEKTEADTAARVAAADRSLLDKFADIRTRWIDSYDARATETEYAEAFREAGIDAFGLPPAEAAALITARRQPVALELVAGLDHWADMVRWIRRDRPRADHLLAVARAADRDPWRNALRETLRQNSGKDRLTALQRLARSAAFDDLPALSFSLLGLGLYHAKDLSTAEAVFRQGVVRHPRDAWLNLQLGSCLSSQQRSAEAIRYLIVARFFRPDTGHFLAHVLMNQGETVEAMAIFRELITIRPDVGAHWACYGSLLQERGEHARAGDVLEKALEMSRKAVERQPNNDSARFTLGRVLAAQGKLPDAIAAFRESIRINPRSGYVHDSLGTVMGNLGKLDEALAEFREAIRLKPDFANAHFNIGRTLHAQGKLDEAKAEYREAIRLNPDFAAAHDGLGSLLRAQGKLGEAAGEHREAIRLKPDFGLAHNNLGAVLVDEGKWSDAIIEYREAIRLKFDDALPHTNLGNALRRQGKVSEAIAECNAAIGLDPNFAEAHFGLGLALRDQRKLQEAIAAYREAIRLKPNHAGFHCDLGVALREQGRLDEAIAEYKTATGIDPNFVDPHVNLGNALCTLGKLDDGIIELREAIRLKPSDVLAHNNLGSALRRQGKVAKAIAEYREAIRLEPGFAGSHLNLGGILCDDRRDYAQAEAEFREAIRLEPNNATAHRFLANALRAQEKLDEAIAESRQAIRLSPDDAVSHLNLGHDLLRQGKLDESIAASREAIRITPDDALPHYNLAEALHSQGKIDEAITEYRKAIRLKPDLAADHYSLGNALYGQGRVDEAIAEYRIAITLEPDFAFAHGNLGNALRVQGKLDEAIAELREAVRLEPVNANDHNNLGLALWGLGKLDEAITEFRLALRLKPDFAVGHWNLGRALRVHGKLDATITEFRLALRLKPDFAECHYDLGAALGNQGKAAEAIAEYREAIRLEPDYAAAHNNLAWALVVSPGRPPRDYEEGLAHARKAVEVSKPGDNPYGTLALAEYREGRWAESLVASQRAMTLRKGVSAYDQFFQAMAHWQMRKKEEAGKSFDKAVDSTRHEAALDRDVIGLWSEAAVLLGRPGPDTSPGRKSDRAH
jgi:serine/threonine-protein kinase